MTDTDNKQRILKAVRLITVIPFLIVLILAIRNAIAGVRFFADSLVYGFPAFFVTIAAYLLNYHYIAIIAVAAFIVLTVRIRRIGRTQQNTSQEEKQNGSF